MHAEFKSVSLFLRGLVTGLPYEMFSPENSKEIMRKNLEDFFSQESPYWKTITPPDSWKENWFFITPTASQEAGTTLVAFCVRKKNMTIRIISGIEGSGFVGELAHYELNFFTCWIDHKSFYEKVSEILLFAINRGNL